MRNLSIFVISLIFVGQCFSEEKNGSGEYTYKSFLDFPISVTGLQKITDPDNKFKSPLELFDFGVGISYIRHYGFEDSLHANNWGLVNFYGANLDYYTDRKLGLSGYYYFPSLIGMPGIISTLKFRDGVSNVLVTPSFALQFFAAAICFNYVFDWDMGQVDKVSSRFELVVRIMPFTSYKFYSAIAMVSPQT